MKWIECSACKLKVRRSEISGNSLPVQHSFRHGGMCFLFFLLLWGSWMIWGTVDIAHWCTLEIHLHLSSTTEWALAIAPERFNRAVGNQREHMVTAGGSSFWWTCPAWCFPVQGTVHFNFPLHLLYTDHLMGWDAPSLTVQMKWDGCIF